MLSKHSHYEGASFRRAYFENFVQKHSGGKISLIIIIGYNLLSSAVFRFITIIILISIIGIVIVIIISSAALICQHYLPLLSS